MEEKQPLTSFLTKEPKQPLESFVKPKEPERESVWSGFKKDIGARIDRLGESFFRQQKGEQTPIETGVHLTGETIGMGYDAAFRAAQGAIRAIPGQPEERIKQVGAAILDTALGKIAIDKLSQGVEVWTDWADEHPRAAENVRSALNIGSLIPIGKGVGFGVRGVVEAGERVAPIVGEVAGKGAKALEQAAKQSQIQQALDIIKPKLTPTEQEKMFERGLTETRGLPGLKTEVQKITKRDRQIAETISDVVERGQSLSESRDAILSKIAIWSNRLIDTAKENDAIFNEKQLRSYLDSLKQESTQFFGRDTSLKNAYEDTIDAFIRTLGTRKKKISELLQSRKDFDKIVERKFPRVFERLSDTDNARSNAILDIRRGVNDFAESLLPENNPMKALLREQTLMYDGISRMATNVRGVIDQPPIKRLMKWVRQNPLAAGMTGGIFTFAAYVGLLTNPITLGSLLLYGTAKLGKKIYTSVQVREALSNILKQIEQVTKPKTIEQKIQLQEDKKMFRDMIDRLSARK